MSKFPINYYLIALIIIGIIYSFLIYGYITDFQSLPSPLFGGDLYFQAGNIYHMYESSFLDWFKSGNMLGELPGYLPFYGIVVTIFGKLFSLNVVQAMLNLNLILPILALLFNFYFLKSLFNSDKMAFLGSLLLVKFTNFPILKYTDFASILLVPLFLYTLWLFYKDQNQKNALLLGVMFAVMGLAHTTSFAYSAASILALFLLILFEKYNQDKQKFSLKEQLSTLLPFFAYSFILGFILSQILWFEPIFLYYGQSELGNNIWATPDVKVFSIGLDIFLSNISSMFLDFSSILFLILSLCSLLGLYLLVKSPFKNKEFTFLLFLFLISFLLTYSYFITSPLFDFHLVPTYMFFMYLSKISLFIGLFFIKEKIFTFKYGDVIIFIVIILLIFYGSFSSYDAWLSNPWIETAKQPLPELYSELQTYLFENSDINTVILSNNELSFGINGFSGRKLVVSRRSQNDPFMDFDQRQLDASIIFYGNDLSKKLELLEKYDVKYLYYDVNWFELEYYYDESGQIISYSDPLMLIASEEKKQALEQSGIYYLEQYGWIDPAMRGDNFRKYDLLLIHPQNYDFTGFGPWKPDIDPYLTTVWSYGIDGQIVAALYEFNPN